MKIFPKKYKPSEGYLAFNKGGFSLIELLVVISILLIIFTFALPNYRNYQRRQALDSVAKGIVSDLRLAQEMASAGNKPTGCGGTPLEGYQFAEISTSQYSILAKCGTNTFTYKTVSLSGVTISVSKTILFKILGQGTDIVSGTSMPITLTQTPTGSTRNIEVDSGGRIEIK